MADDPTTGAPTPAGADPYIHPFPTNAQGQLVNPDAVKKEGQRIRDAQKAEQAKKEAADKIWQTLRDAKPSFLKDGFGLRGPSVPEIRRTTDFSQGSVTREALKPAFPPDATTTDVTTTGVANVFPFKVTQTSPTAPATAALKVYPGKISAIVPKMNNPPGSPVGLDNDPAPKFQITVTAPFSLFLRAKISVDTDNLFRSTIGLFPTIPTDNGVTVLSDNDPLAVPDIDPMTSEIPELKVFWENSPTNTIGHFYIRIADIDVNGDGKVIGIRQWLFNSYSSFVAAGNEVVILV